MLANCLRRSVQTVLGMLLLGCAGLAWAQQDQSLSPYFAVDGGDPAVDSLPLKSTEVQVRILGVMADVRVLQRYRNEGQQALEARYVFPGSTRAAVYGMTVRLGERELRAQIREKQKAREEYQQAKSAGKTAALLEQQRENVFQMNVANILPGDDVEVELRYTELLLPTEGVYRFVYPSVVGPRYNGKVGTAAHKAEPWIAAPYLADGEASAADFKLSLELLAPTPLNQVSSPSHPLLQERLADNRLRLSLGDDGRPANNRDFVLDYRLAGEGFASGVLLGKGEQENFFLALLAPPQRAPAELIVPREYIFVVDISGSMHGFPLDTAKVLLRKLIGSLRPADSFNVLLFSGSSSMLAPHSQPATPENIDTALALLDTEMGSGGTELLPALRQALAIPLDAERSRSFVVVTDGFVTVEREAFRLVRENLDKANLFAFGIGSSVNRQLIEGLARAGQGEPFVVLDAATAEDEAERLRRMIEAPLLAHPRVTIEGLDVYDVEPLRLPDLFAERPLAVFGKWRGAVGGSLRIEGQGMTGPYHAELPIGPNDVVSDGQALSHLWARQRVASLVDQETLEGGYEYSQAILDLGLKYALLTPYTSFVAVDERVRNSHPDAAAKVTQPSPLPQGVGNQAIGGLVPSTPEPGLWSMLLVALLGAGWCLRGRNRVA